MIQIAELLLLNHSPFALYNIFYGDGRAGFANLRNRRETRIMTGKDVALTGIPIIHFADLRF
jgi:hypothetical protein